MTDSPISSDPAILGGKPCLRGTRISVEFVLELLASGMSAEGIAETYPQLTTGAVQAAIAYAARSMKNDVLWEVQIPA